MVFVWGRKEGEISSLDLEGQVTWYYGGTC